MKSTNRTIGISMMAGSAVALLIGLAGGLISWAVIDGKLDMQITWIYIVFILSFLMGLGLYVESKIKQSRKYD